MAGEQTLAGIEFEGDVKQNLDFVFSDAFIEKIPDIQSDVAARLSENSDDILCRLMRGRIMGCLSRSLNQQGCPTPEAVDAGAKCLADYKAVLHLTGEDLQVAQNLACDLAEIPALAKEGLTWVGKFGSKNYDTYKFFDASMQAMGKQEQLVSLLDQNIRDAAALPFGILKQSQVGDAALYLRQGVEQGKTIFQALLEAQQAAIDRGVPPVLVNTLPKSGTLFLVGALTKAFSAVSLMLSLGGFPRNYAVAEFVKLFARGGAVSVGHLDAHPDNLKILKDCGIKKIVIHVRDPRQTTVSWFHHIQNNMTGPEYYTRLFVQPPIPDSYNGMQQDERLAWCQETFFPNAFRWIESWWKVGCEQTDLEVLFTQQEKMRLDSAATLNEILSFFGSGIRLSSDDVRPPKPGEGHFRKGRTDEWREVFTSSQQEEMGRLMAGNAELCAAFGWDI